MNHGQWLVFIVVFWFYTIACAMGFTDTENFSAMFVGFCVVISIVAFLYHLVNILAPYFL